MKIRYCKQCGDPITDSVHAWYCPKCRKLREKARQEANKERYNFNRQKKYAEKKYGKKPKTETPLDNITSASERYRRMSLREISAECARLHLTYGQAQVMAQSGTLPNDFGLECVR